MAKYIYENGIPREMTEEEIAANEQVNPYEGMTYVELVRMFIAERYTIEDEIAILRQKDTKPEEFAIYNAYCEECKLRAKQILGIE